MQAFDLVALRQAQEDGCKLYYEFLKVDALSMGLYVLAVGSPDPQQPHTEDEVYYIISGRADILVGEDVQSVQSGTVVYVPAGIEHRFQNISEDLTLLVFFAPAEYSLAGG